MRVVLPDRGDLRLRLALVITALQVLGQAGLGFRVSIAQILVALAAAALPEAALSAWRERALVWPASALLTGNSVAFILRTDGTRHGDWWSLNGWEWFVAASLIGVASKHLVKAGGRHLYNPSNLGLVIVLLLAGPGRVYPQALYWGPLEWPVLLALLVILAGAVWILRPLGMLPMVAAFLAAFWVLLLVLAAAGRCFVAAWHPPGPVCGTGYWTSIALSPELLVFTFFMISDPRTAPAGGLGRTGYALAVAVVAAVLLAFQPSEYGIKVALLAALVVVCSFVPWSEGRRSYRWAGAAAALLITLAVPAGMIALAGDPAALAVDGGHPIPRPHESLPPPQG